MGAKFAHFSIFQMDVEEAIKLLGGVPGTPMNADRLEAFMKKTSPSDFKPLTDEAKEAITKLFNMANKSRKEYMVGVNGKWTTVFNEWFDWSSIEEAAITFSKKTEKICFDISMFDSDVFTLSVYKKGKVLTRHISGATEIYDKKSSLGDIDIIADTFGITEQKETLQKVLEKDDLEEKVTDLEKLFNVKLWRIYTDLAKKMGWKKVTV